MSIIDRALRNVVVVAALVVGLALGTWVKFGLIVLVGAEVNSELEHQRGVA